MQICRSESQHKYEPDQKKVSVNAQGADKNDILDAKNSPGYFFSPGSLQNILH